MISGKEYSTRNKKRILDYLVKNKELVFTVQDIYFALQSDNVQLNITTVYRYLNKLSQDGTIIKRIASKGEMATFQYIGEENNCKKHLHMQCQRCGKIIHLDCGFMDEISVHIFNHHDFEIECTNSVIYGICGECRKD